jgi:dynactin complex subunit
LEISLLVDAEVEVSQYEDGEKFASAKMDVNEIISNVRDFVDSIKETTVDGQRMAVGVDIFNFSVEKTEGKYNLKLNVSFSLSPKELV